MSIPVIMPRQGQSVESCVISKWYKKKGDTVRVGDILFAYETDKASFEEEAKAEGVVLDIFYKEGDDVPVLTTVCVIGAEGESTEGLSPAEPAAAKTEAKDERKEAGHAVSKTESINDGIKAVPANDREDNEKIRISPRARNLADKLGVDYRSVTPSGPYGRIVVKDVYDAYGKGLAAASAAKNGYANLKEPVALSGTGLGGRITAADLSTTQEPSASMSVSIPEIPAEVAQKAGDGALQQTGYEDVKLTSIRKLIANSMQLSISSTAQLTISSSFDATEILEYRKKLKDGCEKLEVANITINDIILFAVSRTLPYHRDLNAHFLGDKMRYFKNVNLGIAVDTERGLMVPTIFNADLKPLAEIAAEVKKLAEECQKGSVNPDSLKGGTFTVTNMGMLGVESFTPVLNPPQTGILGVCCITRRVRENGGSNEYYPAIGLSLTFDHRALDGAPAARFLQQLKTNLENFSVLLAK